MYDQAQLMLCHCIGGVIPGCGVIFDNSSDGYSCKHAAVCWKYYALYNKLVHSLRVAPSRWAINGLCNQILPSSRLDSISANLAAATEA